MDENILNMLNTPSELDMTGFNRSITESGKQVSNGLDNLNESMINLGKVHRKLVPTIINLVGKMNDLETKQNTILRKLINIEKLLLERK